MRSMSDFIMSKEGVTQGDPLSMYVYVIGTLPLIKSLQFCIQPWYADNASAGGLLTDLHKWLLHLCLLRPNYGLLYLVWRSLLLRDNCFVYPYSLVTLVFNLVIMSDNCYDLSVRSAQLLRESILGCATFELDADVRLFSLQRALIDSIRKFNVLLISCLVRFDSLQQ